jgi:hypothetical protein
MEITTGDIADIPAGNLRVPRAEFAAVWMTAEQLHDQRATRRVSDWYSTGVVATCRWLARATVHPASGPSHPARSPITGHPDAHQNLIEAEYVEAARLALRQPQPTWLAQRPGWIEGIEATLLWAWHHHRDPPLEIHHT